MNASSSGGREGFSGSASLGGFFGLGFDGFLGRVAFFLVGLAETLLLGFLLGFGVRRVPADFFFFRDGRCGLGGCGLALVFGFGGLMLALGGRFALRLAARLAAFFCFSTFFFAADSFFLTLPRFRGTLIAFRPPW